IRKFAEKKGGLCLATEHVNRRDPLEWQCKEGHKWRASAKDILKGTWYRRCSTPSRKHVIPSQKIIPVQGHITPDQESPKM
ncbi:9556_t:CDS:2, partial [Funneliformis mosseae]